MTRLEIIQNISPRFDFTVYTKVCIENSIEPQSKRSFAQLMGMLSAAETMFPDDKIDDAFNKYLEFINTEEVQTSQNDTKKPCSSCGGGKVV